jgi:hypothetical protein
VLPPDELLDALAAALRHDVGPAVVDPFAKTQAFMAAVILQKLAGQLRAEPVDEDGERAAVVADVRALTGDAPTLALPGALDRLAADGDTAAWRSLVTALYADRDDLGPVLFDGALARLRRALRARLDRALAYSS